MIPRQPHSLLDRPMPVLSRTFALLCLLTSLSAAQQPTPSLRHVGTVHFPISCNPSVRSTFDHAVALLHSFAFSEATADLNTLLSRDPHCAIAQWALALCAWGNPFAPGIRSQPQLERGLIAIQQARTVGRPTARERAYIEAAAHLYEHADTLDQRSRLLAYRDAMSVVAAKLPADTEAGIFHALALVISADPADKTYASQRAAAAILEPLFHALPNHPGLAHYLIHTYDVPALATRGLTAAHRYAKIAPDLSHALHMPSHIFTRAGDWRESIAANLAAAAAAHREGAVAEELHATDYAVYAYLQMGQDQAAATIVAGVPAIGTQLDPARITTGAPPAAGYFALAAIPARYALERGQWAEAARLPTLVSPVPYADASTYFARALGAARGGDTVSAKEDLAALARIRDTLAEHHEAYWSEQVAIQELSASAWVVLSAGRKEEAIAMMADAAAREDATDKSVVSPGPLAPAHELLGEMLFALQQPAKALRAFESSLRKEPNRLRSVVGAARAADAIGDTTKAKRYRRQAIGLCPHTIRTGQAVTTDTAGLTWCAR